MQNSEIPWIEKYRPQTLQDMVGFEDVINNLSKFISNFMDMRKKYLNLKKQIKSGAGKGDRKIELQFKSIKSRLSNQTAAVLIGPPGVGKTTIVYALAHDFNLSVIELNASDVRTEDAVIEKLNETVKNTNLLSFTQNNIQGKLILIDEVDGIHGKSDRGGVAALKKIISFSRYPVIMTCNFKDYRRFGDLYKLSSPLLEIKPAKPEDIAKILQRIAIKENITITPDQIKQIAVRSNGDYRSAINDLQGLAQGSLKIQAEQLDTINMSRDHAGKIQETLYSFFAQKTIKEAKRVLDEVESKEISFNNIHLWLNENIFLFLTKKDELFHGFQNLAFVDKILGYIGRTQDYGHLSYFYDILSGGLRFAKLSPTSSSKVINGPSKMKKIQSPRYFRIRATPDDEIALLLQKTYRAPLNEIMRDIRPLLPTLIESSREIKQYIAEILRTDPKNVIKIVRN